MNVNTKILNSPKLYSTTYKNADILWLRLTPEIEGWLDIQILLNVLYHINRMMDKSHMIISINAGKTFDKISGER